MARRKSLKEMRQDETEEEERLLTFNQINDCVLQGCWKLWHLNTLLSIDSFVGSVAYFVRQSLDDSKTKSKLAGFLRFYKLADFFFLVN